MTVAKSIIATTAHFQAGTEERDEDRSSLKSEYRKTLQHSGKELRIGRREGRSVRRSERKIRCASRSRLRIPACREAWPWLDGTGPSRRRPGCPGSPRSRRRKAPGGSEAERPRAAPRSGSPARA